MGYASQSGLGGRPLRSIPRSLAGANRGLGIGIPTGILPFGPWVMDSGIRLFIRLLYHIVRVRKPPVVGLADSDVATCSRSHAARAFSIPNAASGRGTAGAFGHARITHSIRPQVHLK